MPKTTASTTSTMVKVSEEPSSLRMTQVASKTLHPHSRHIVQHHHVRSSQHSSDNRHAPPIQHPHRQYIRRRKDRKINSRTPTLRTRTVIESKQAQSRLRPKAETWVPGSHIPVPVVAEPTIPLLLIKILTIMVFHDRQTIHAQQLRRVLPTSLTTQCHLLELNHPAVPMAKLTFRQTDLLAAGDHLQITTTSPLDPLVAPAVGNR